MRSYGPHLATASIETLHQLRIEFKKLRYTFEFLREALGEDTKALIKQFKSIQDHLGNLNDADVVCYAIQSFLNQAGENPSLEPVAAYLAYRQHERTRLVQTFAETWGQFENPAFRALLAQAIARL